MTTISLDAAVNAVLGDEATARHRAVLGKQCRDPDARVARCREARALLREQRVSQGDNVKALCELRPSGATLWRWVQLAETAHAQLLAKRARGDDEALVLGLVAPAGGGKSTLSQVLKLLLRAQLGVDAVEELSLDDFLASRAERATHGIRTRWDLNATNEDYAGGVLGALKRSPVVGPASEVRVPCFSKGLDERTQQERVVRGAVDIIIFEGWRVGVAHPNFFCFNALVDYLFFLSVDFEAIIGHKLECVRNDIARCGYDMYAAHGGYERVFEQHYKRMYYDWIEAVRDAADVVIHKDGAHEVTAIDEAPGRWAEEREKMALEEFDAVVLGAGQAGLCAAYYLQRAGLRYVAFEKGASCGETWRTARWDSFRLVTENSLCNLPGFGCERVGQDPRGFMPKDVICEYLHSFYEHNGLNVRFNEHVTAVTRGWRDTWVARTSAGRWVRARSVVCAIGGFHAPRLPAWADRLPETVTKLHSSQYRNPAQLGEGAALVIGTAQSGTQIAAELAESGKRVYACVGASSHRVPRRVRGWDFTRWLAKTGLYDTCIEDLPEHKQREKRFGPNPSQAPARDVRLRALCHERGLVLLGRAKGLADDGDTIALDGPNLPVYMRRIEGNAHRMQLVIENYVQQHHDDPELRDLGPREIEPEVPIPECERAPRDSLSLAEAGVTSVIFATGFSLRFHDIIDLPDLYDDRGYPRQRHGAAEGYAGLYFLGLNWMHTWKSAIMYGCAADAEHVCKLARVRCATASLATLPRAAEAAAAGVVALPEGQLSSENALSSEWRCHFDHVRDGDAVLLREAPVTARRPLSYARFRAFVEEELSPQDFGVGQGDRLCVVLPNGAEAAVCFLAMSLFCTYAPLNAVLTEREFEFEFDDLPAKAVVVMAGAAASAAALRVAHAKALPVIELVPSEDDVGLFSLRWADTDAERRLPPLPGGRAWPRRDDVAMVLHTSGTTKKPKIVPLTHGNITSGVLCIASTLQLESSDVAINIMPLFHIHGIAVNVLATAVSGACVVATAGLSSAEAFFDALKVEPRPTWYSAVPTMHQRILAYAEVYYERHGKPPPSALQFVRNCSAALLPTVAERMEHLLGVEVLTTYAMTESMPIASNPRRGERRLRSVGFAGGPEVMVLMDPPADCRPVAPGSEGHVCVRGACVTAGYEYRGHMGVGNNPNDEAFTAEGFLCTGDKGYIDSAGHLVLVGRFKEIINRGGEKISPFEVEDALLGHAAVRDMICFAMPHELYGEVVGAAVVLRAGVSLTLDELRGFGVSRGLNGKWLPEALVTMNTIPKGPTGKPARINLAQKLQLPALRDAPDGEQTTSWDVPDMPPSLANDARLTARPHLAEMLAAEEAPMDEALGAGGSGTGALGAGGSGTVELNAEAWARTLRTYLVPALSSEVMRLARLSEEAVSLESPFPLLGIDSERISTLRGRLRLALGVDMGLAPLMTHSIKTLVDAIIDGHSGSANSAAAAAATSAALDEAAAPAVDALAPFALLPMQSLYWIGRSKMVSPPQPAWIQWEAVLPELDAPRFEAAVDKLVARHGALRTVMQPDGLQRIEAAPAPFRLVRNESSESLRAVREDMIASFGHSYPLWKIQAVREPSGGWRLLFLFDLLVADAQALCVLTEELHALYENPDANLAPLSLTLPVYVARVARRNAAADDQRRREEVFWRKADVPPEEGGMPPCPQLPMVRGSRPGLGAISRISGGLSAPQWQALRRAAAGRSLTPTSLLFAAYAHVLAGWSESPRFTLNCAFFGRDSREAQVARLVGNLAGTILVDVDASSKIAPSFEALAKELQARVLETMEHSQCTSGEHVMGRLNNRDDTQGRAVAPFVFASVLGATEGRRGNPFTWYGRTPASAALTTPQVWLDVQVFNDVDGGLYFNWDAHVELFPPGLVQTLFDAFSSLLERLARDAPRTLAERPSLVPESQTRERDALHERETKRQLLERVELLHCGVERAALRAPRRTAVVDGASGAKFDFETLMELARAYARRVVEASDGARRPVALVMDKGWAQVVGVLAALLAGCAYVPLSVQQPVERMAVIIQDVEALVVLHDGRAALPSLPAAARAICVERHAAADADQPLRCDATVSDLAYIIYTSGSTGRPKGVMISHRGAGNTCLDINERWGVGEDDVVLSLAALSFDLSVYDIFGVMAAGGTLVMPDAKQALNPKHWLDLMETWGVTVWNTAPPVMTMLLEYVNEVAEARERFVRLPLRLVLLSGDFVPLKMAATLRKLLKTSALRVCALGGATEASIWSCYHEIKDVEKSWTSIPYGRALANQSMHVLNEDLQPVPDLVHGEICIGGTGLAEGYFGDDEKTAKAFVWSEALRKRVYRTGDRGRHLPGGDIEILGRMDFQVKVNGYRVEIGEVEAGLRSAAPVRDAVVLPQGPQGRQRLLGYVIFEGGADAAVAAAQEALRRSVPDYMHPERLHALTEWPMSANGKVDRKALLRLDEEAMPDAPERVDGALPDIDPRNEYEKKIHAVWSDVLGRSDFGVMASWRDLGGKSLGLMSMSYRVAEKLKIEEIGFDVLQRHRTIASLATFLQAAKAPPARAGRGFRSMLVPSNSAGAAPVAFFVAPVSGTTLCYERLIARLGVEQPFVALQHEAIDISVTTLEELAADLCEALLSHLDSLPAGRRSLFSLGGWSMGGVLALEMALQLRRRGVVPGLEAVVLVDSPAPMGEADLGSVATPVDTLVAYARDLTAYGGGLPDAAALRAHPTPARAMLDALHKAEALPVELGLESFEGDVAVYKRNLRALAAYRPRLDEAEAHALTLHLLRATRTNAHLAAYAGHARVDFGWGACGFVPSKVLLYLYEGDHYGMVRDEALPGLCESLRPLLAHAAVRAPPAAASPTSEGSSMTLQLGREARGHRRVVRPRARHALPGTPHAADGFRISAGAASDGDATKCAQDAYASLLRASGVAPDLILVSAKADVDGAELVASLRRMAPTACVQAVSTVAGALHNGGSDKVGLLGITDPRGRYSVGFAPGASSAATAREAGRVAARQAWQRGLLWEAPDVIVVNASPGAEELILAGIADVVGADVPCIGGSAADVGDIDGRWWVRVSSPDAKCLRSPRLVPLAGVSEGGAEGGADGVAVAMLWPSVETAMVFSSCYTPTAARGTITKCERREVVEIDGKPAADVYVEWTKDARLAARFADAGAAQPLNVLADTTLAPLARQVGGSASEPSHLLIHPETVTARRGLTTFAEVEEGQELLCMSATSDELVHLVLEATAAPDVAEFCESLRGALAVFCGGCSLFGIGKDRLPAVACNLSRTLGGKPFVVMLTYGEQGVDLDGTNGHGNLMYSLLLFGAPKPTAPALEPPRLTRSRSSDFLSAS